MIPDLIIAVAAALLSLLYPLVSLNSIEKVDDHPLYIMHYSGSYEAGIAFAEVVDDLDLRSDAAPTDPAPADSIPAWACSLFVTARGPEGRFYGRNFDWQHSPAVLLFTDPPDGYASVSMVDIAYIVPARIGTDRLDELPLLDRRDLLYAPFLPFDGMNEHGLVVGMAAVPYQTLPRDPGRDTLDSLAVIRAMLDHARTVDEAVAILRGVNVDMGSGPWIHYLIADRNGDSVLAEFYDGQLVLHRNTESWQAATNFLQSAADGPLESQCPRYRTIAWVLTGSGGQIAPDVAMSLLSVVSQSITQWSVVYGIDSGAVWVTMEREYGQVYQFGLE